MSASIYVTLTGEKSFAIRRIYDILKNAGLKKKFFQEEFYLDGLLVFLVKDVNKNFPWSVALQFNVDHLEDSYPVLKKIQDGLEALKPDIKLNKNIVD